MAQYKKADPKCKLCHGTGEVRTMAPVDQREPHLVADVGTAKCPCTKAEPEEREHDDYNN